MNPDSILKIQPCQIAKNNETTKLTISQWHRYIDAEDRNELPFLPSVRSTICDLLNLALETEF